MDKKNKRRIIAAVVASFDGILSTCAKIGNNLDESPVLIPIELYNEVINASKWNNENNAPFITAYNKMMDDLFNSAKELIDKYGDESVPFKYIQITVMEAKKSFLEAAIK